MYLSLDSDATSRLHYFQVLLTGVNGEGGGGAQKEKGKREGASTTRIRLPIKYWRVLLRPADFTREFTVFTISQLYFCGRQRRQK